MSFFVLCFVSFRVVFCCFGGLILNFFIFLLFVFVASPSMGDIELALFDRKGSLEVEVVRAKGLLPKPGSKILPGVHVQLATV